MLQRLGTSSTATQAPTRNAVYRRRRHVAPRDTTRHVPPIDSQTCQMMRGSESHNQPSSMLIYVLRCLSLLLELLLMVVIPTTQFVFSAPLPLRFALAIGLLLVLHFHRLPLPLHQPVNTSLPLRCCRDVRRPNPFDEDTSWCEQSSPHRPITPPTQEAAMEKKKRKTGGVEKTMHRNGTRRWSAHIFLILIHAVVIHCDQNAWEWLWRRRFDKCFKTPRFHSGSWCCPSC
ncbi:hypothetical protein ECG_00460 [Echinococcus granulosus]|nr:hypothetical protein ECG_00460 [Echinococcus granulosus]